MSSDNSWTDMIIGERMKVDKEFGERVEQAGFTRQEWSLVMTAVEFEIEDPGGENPRLVAETSKIKSIIPEMERVESMTPGGQMGEKERGKQKSSGGFLSSIMNSLGLGKDESRSDDEKEAKAKQLAQEYAERLQEKLEEGEKWERIQKAAKEEKEQG